MRIKIKNNGKTDTPLNVHFSKETDDWSTPEKFYNELHKEFNFNFDPCPLRSVDKTTLLKDWKGRAFVNPPYSNIRNFLEKAIIEVRKGNCELAVLLIPSRTDTRWFHDLIYNRYEIRFIKGRLKFGDSKNSAPFPSMLVIIKTD